MKSNRLSSSGSSCQFRRKAVALGVAMAIASPVYANPTGMSVVAGQATAQTIGNLMQITNTPGAILNWQQFNIDVGQTTQFIQQNAASQVFNRVTGGDVSQILGTLQSNGQVFLINPAGVFFGQGAVVDTAGFLASSLAASNADLLNGHLKFHDANGNAGGIVNQGSLTTHSGGSIVLLAPSIENSGVIHAEGEVLLAAGHSVTIVDMNHPTIGLTVAAKAGEKAVNLGRIISKNASLFSHLVNNSGVVEATGAQLGEGGVIRFIAQGDVLVSGQVLAESTSGKGGEIDITGDRVAVLGGARISADGATGGGTVHVGGGWKGQDDSIANAQQTVVQANTQISANAVDNGDGGEVVVWADGHTTVNSEVQAKGGALSGNGGRVETSGLQSLSVNVAANTSAHNGKAGQWLIDPANLTIVDQIPEGGFNQENSSQSPFFSTDDISPSFSPTESFLLNSTVVQGLQTNGFVSIKTTGTLPGEGNITVAAPVLVSQNQSESTFLTPQLYLEAKGAINIDAAVGIQAGQTEITSFDLFLDYDIAKPVYINAPIHLGEFGLLTLRPYDAGTVMRTNTVGQLPLDGVNLLSGMNATGTTGPLALNQINLASTTLTDPNDPMTTLSVSPDSSVKLNVLGANVAVNNIIGFSETFGPALDVRVGSGNLQYNQLFARSLTVDAGGTVSSFTREFSGQTSGSGPSTGLDQLVSSGTVNFNGGFNSIGELVTDAGTLNFANGPGSSSAFGFYEIADIAAGAESTMNLRGATLFYNTATLNGAFNVLNDASSFGAFVGGVDTNLNGSLNMGAGSHNVSLQSLGMGSNALIRVSTGSSLELGSNSASFQFETFETTPKAPGAYISSSGGQFVAQQGARIILDGSVSAELPDFQPLEVTASLSFSEPVGAVLNITGLDGQLDAPVLIESNGFFNQISTGTNNFNFNENSSTSINTMLINQASIQVNAGGDGEALVIGQFPFSQFSGLDTSSFTDGSFQPTVDLDFNGSLTVNSGRVRLFGDNVSSTGGTLNVSGANSLIGFTGAFTSADLFGVNRSNGGRLAVEGFWDNTAVNATNAATAAPLAKGDILAEGDLIIVGGLLSSAGTNNAINISPDGFVELRSTEVSSTINLAPTAALMLGSQNVAGVATAPVVLKDANINMGGDSLLIVETDAQGTANLNGTATISSGAQGNLILAGRRVFDSSAAAAAPDQMSLNVGSGIRLNVTGDASSLPPSLALYYTQLGVTDIPDRPVFLVGQLTPQAIAVTEYNEFGFFNSDTGDFSGPVTTVLEGFANPSFVIDGNPDSQFPDGIICSAIDFCVKFAVDQDLTFSGMVMTSLDTMDLANSGVAFVEGADLSNLKFAIQTPGQIQFMQGLNILTVADLVGGKTLVNGPNSTIRFGANTSNETIANDLQNDGLLELQGIYTLSGLLTGSGVLSNSGTLLLNNNTGSLISNGLFNTGTITNAGSYILTNVVGGAGLFVNNGGLTLTGSGLFGNAISNSGPGSLSFSGGSSQNLTFAGDFNNSSVITFNGGFFAFNANGFNQTSGDTIVLPGTVLGGNVNIGGGALRGFATVDGNLNAEGGQIVPGASPGLMTVTGDLTLDANSVIDIEILSDGGEQGVDFDCIVVGGTATLAGQLNLIDISSGNLQVGSQYAFLQAGDIVGTFDAVSNAPVSSAYTFSAPELSNMNTVLSTSTVTTNFPPPPPPAEQPVDTVLPPGNTGTTDSVIGQNLDQAFTPQNTTTTQTSTTSTQQEDEAVVTADQSTGGTVNSQQSSNIELTSTPSDPQRASAVCK